MAKISKSFTWEEYTKSDTAKAHHINNQITDWDVRDNAIALFDNLIQPARDAYGEPVFVTSGYRCKELNELVGGVEKSQHPLGEAVDVTCSDLRRFAEIILKLRLPFDQLGIANNYLHISHKREGENRGKIFYYANYRGKRDLK
jgi:uncharacterized protein YcbK (DUF882 family)